MSVSDIGEINSTMLKNVRENLISALNGDTPDSDIPTAVEFSESVEVYARDNHCTLIESMCDMVEYHKLDISDTPRLITDALKQKLAVEQGFEKPETSLPLG